MKLRRKWLLLIASPMLGLFVYVGAAFIVFDFSRAAYPSDEENHEGREVAIGPRPRRLFCPPTWEGVRWEGREWPFVVFAPICSCWRDEHGYAPSHAWR
jgi:hypothetical protein